MSRLCMIVLCTLALTAALSADERPNPFYGDWQGTLRLDAGGERPVVAQVIDWGRDGFQANLLPAFDERIAPLAVLRGTVEGEALSFGDGGSIADGVFRGTLTGDSAGSFELRPVERVSPTLGAEAPADGVVLFDGSDLALWQSSGPEAFMANLGPLGFGDNCVGFLRSRVTSPKEQEALLEVGSDDGIQVWLNGTVVHRKPVFRSMRAWEDRVPVTLREGENTLLLEILQGGGDMSGCARFLTVEGEPLEGLSFDPTPTLPEGRALAEVQDGPGTVVTWECAGPYRDGAKSGIELVDAEFAPVTAPETVTWKIVNDKPEMPRRWRLVGDGSVEVLGGAGSLVSKAEFGDHRLHIEFRTPWEPDGRDQGRGNSGVYLQGRYEIQVLDSYGLEGHDYECGGFYATATPKVNAAYPPLTWQTYDVDFHAPRRDADGNVSDAVVDVWHNGVLIHEGLRLGNQLGEGDVQRGPVLLQDHGHLVRYRNIWVAPLEGSPGLSE